ncbi:MAG: quorum-sensing autoinducer CAI-1 synthase [Sulfurimicrobium sp.]|nr:quorum-sensing autoinducer CAI-1 synthase [Sulfurimicrobium sp.]MDP1706014.1 quorum-sensing autoinducer CAI-1 synthase [Sulfurimicrobium sp.]MDP2197774.1 quorum-sensing autoinducer CAI-1 synthase [Sulfurimicrobium sp.]MDP2962410.1 quorum-sensing autoinducer CAI-1 synthase [Sulfurimicrobium sp.]MDP3687228.1 quorum-sensing autoinducer CAI-1 synthase [Sulfurimicrobium sp.]
MDQIITPSRHNSIFINAPEPDFLSRRVDGYYRERVQNTWDGGHIMRGRTPGKDALHLSSNDYLSLSRHPEILRAGAECLLEEGNGLLMSGIFLHGDNPLLDLERRMAHFMEAEGGILCQSGFAANTGLLQSIASENTPVYVDMMAHMSLWEGIRSAGARAVAFHHNDVEHLERQVLKHGPGVILVDSVYSTNGSVCPLRDVVALGTRHGCVLVVDESHSLGTHGLHGEGMVAHLGLTGQVHFRTASLAKAFAGRAGFIACSARFSEYIKYESNPSIFSSTLLPHEVAVLGTTLDVIRSESWRRRRLCANAEYLRRRLDALGYNLNGSQTQIIALESGSERQTIVLRDALEARGIFGSVFCAPATAKNRALIRLSVNSALTEAELDRIAGACRDIREEVDMANWASTRRKSARAAVPLHGAAAA